MNDTTDAASPGAAYARFRMLLWTRFALGMLTSALAPEAAMVAGMGTTIGGIVLVAAIVLYGISAWVNVQLLKGKNWARIAYTLGLLTWGLFLADISGYGVAEMLLSTVALALDVYLVYLMFADPLRARFARPGRVARRAGG